MNRQTGGLPHPEYLTLRESERRLSAGLALTTRTGVDDSLHAWRSNDLSRLKAGAPAGRRFVPGVKYPGLIQRGLTLINTPLQRGVNESRPSTPKQSVLRLCVSDRASQA